MRFLLALPVLVILVVFALSNRQVVGVGLWPTDIRVELPLSWVVLVASALFFVAGAAITWGGALSARSRLRRAESTVRQLEAQLEATRARPGLKLLPPAA